MYQDLLQLNTEKTEIKKRLKVSAQLESMTLKSTNQAKNHGVAVNSDLNCNSHIKKITKSA